MPDTLLPVFSRIFQAGDCTLPQDGRFFLWNSMEGKITEGRLENDAFL
jgi:hypothetical protein